MKTRGLYEKFRVEKVSDPEGKHHDCRYFVLDPFHDPLAWWALGEYARRAAAVGKAELAADLNEWLEEI